MPVYMYKCRDCGRMNDVSRSAEDRDLPLLCHLCDGPTDRRWAVAGVVIR